MKKCIYCFHEMNDDAIKCSHCGEYADMKYKWRGVSPKPKRFGTVFCTVCHHTGPGKVVTKGSFGIELILWLCLFVPGIIYSLRRSSTKKCICSHCKSNMVNRI